MMQTGKVTTPFGRRPMTIALARRQLAVADIKTGKSANKWQVFRDVSAAFQQLGLQSNSLAVLDALLSFHPETELRHDSQLVVFPSNLQLSLRAHSMAEATLRRHLAVLVNAGLIVRKDSANGKRYVRKGRAGEVEGAFGFDLSPLLARSEELAMMAQQVVAERMEFRKAKEDLTICRRDVRKLISAAISEGAEGDWQVVEDIYVALVGRMPRAPSLGQVAEILDEMELLHQEVLNRLNINENSEKEIGNAALIERHIQNSNTESIIEFEPSSEKEQGAKRYANMRNRADSLKVFPLGMVLKACPTIADYGPGGAVANWRDLMSAAIVVRSMLGVSPSAYEEACGAMGPENAATSIACILERAPLIKSAGGYLRDLTLKSERGEFSLGPMVMALLRFNGSAEIRRA